MHDVEDTSKGKRFCFLNHVELMWFYYSSVLFMCGDQLGHVGFLL